LRHAHSTPANGSRGNPAAVLRAARALATGALPSLESQISAGFAGTQLEIAARGTAFNHARHPRFQVSCGCEAAGDRRGRPNSTSCGEPVVETLRGLAPTAPYGRQRGRSEKRLANGMSAATPGPRVVSLPHPGTTRVVACLVVPGYRSAETGPGGGPPASSRCQVSRTVSTCSQLGSGPLSAPGQATARIERRTRWDVGRRWRSIVPSPWPIHRAA